MELKSTAVERNGPTLYENRVLNMEIFLSVYKVTHMLDTYTFIYMFIYLYWEDTHQNIKSDYGMVKRG